MSRYSETLLDHVRSPRNGGAIRDADAIGDASLQGAAPFVRMFLKYDADIVAAAAFEAFGCGGTIASCSILTELVAGHSKSECRAITAEQVIKDLGGMPRERYFCAELAVDALQDALNKS